MRTGSVGLALASGLLWATAACREPSTATVPEPVAIVEDLPSLFAGDTLQLHLHFADSGLALEPVTWSSDEPLLATVSPDGIVSALAPGLVRIRATAGELGAIADVAVLPIEARVNRQIAYIRRTFAIPYPLFQLRLFDPSDSSDRGLTIMEPGLVHYGWSGNGSRLATLYWTQGWGASPERAGLWVVDPETGEQARILATADDFAWAPDGSLLVVASAGALFVTDPTGVDRRPLTTRAGTTVDAGPAWSPDARRIAFRRGSYELWVVRADGSGERLLYRGTSFLGTPKWSPDGKMIAFSEGNFSLRTAGLFVIGANGLGVRPVSSNCQAAQCEYDGSLFGGFDWSPDARSLVYGTMPASSQVGHYEIATMPGPVWTPFFWPPCIEPVGYSPDGQLIGLLCIDYPSTGIHVVAQNGTDKRSIVRGAERATWRP